MRIAVFSTKSYTREFFERTSDQFNHELAYLEPRLTRQTAGLAAGFPAVCVFVNDTVNAEVLNVFHEGGTRVVALRCSGFNNVDLVAAERLGISVVRVPAYSPYAVAEHTVALILALNRQVHRAFNRVREGNFALDGLVGFDLRDRVVGVVGTGKIGQVVTRIMSGFSCRVLAYDPYPNDEVTKLGARYVQPEELLRESDIVTLHCPLLPDTHHIVDAQAIKLMKPGVMLVNTSRGALIDTRAVIAGLKSGQIGYLGLDVYEEEADLFFENLSDQVIQDDVFARLLTFPNVVITGHQAFFTSDALASIAEVTFQNLADIEAGRDCANAVHAEKVHA